MLSIPITRLPATLGRSHDTKDTHFFGLGTQKVLSRNQAVIFWRDRLGGKIIQTGTTSDKLIYQPPPKGGVKEVIRPNPDELLPELGYVCVSHYVSTHECCLVAFSTLIWSHIDLSCTLDFML
jgi:hypothetical protein